jgi:hypothetical protein
VGVKGEESGNDWCIHFDASCIFQFRFKLFSVKKSYYVRSKGKLQVVYVRQKKFSSAKIIRMDLFEVTRLTIKIRETHVSFTWK